MNINHGDMVEAENDEGTENLLKHTGLQEARLKVVILTRKRPVIMIYDVNADLKYDDIRQDIYSKSLRDSGITAEDFNSEFDLNRKYKHVRSKENKVLIVVDCSLIARNLLRGKQRIFIEW